MKLFPHCSGPCETCKINYIGHCLAGGGDDLYSYADPEWIKKHGEKQQKAIQTYTVISKNGEYISLEELAKESDVTPILRANDGVHFLTKEEVEKWKGKTKEDLINE